ncbi:DeoR/GlpR family DNA-binding transcription regulator [Leifsonia sp. SIMBA_070]|uniref:DeoR/GlpR family DNA-binding transcription regulator n=1 Tax=Leifsonia sp. SIMBA_070 TaxID=3085810 RepID=UPI00397DE0BA
MIAAQRRTLIAEIVRDEGAASIAALARRLDVSPVTVRRDLDFLDSLGLVQRSHGGATAGSQNPEAPYADKIGQAMPEKAAIGRLAAGLVHDGDVIAVGPGTTTEWLARALTGRTGLTIVTNSLLVADVFVDSSSNQVILTGGELRGSIRAVVGDAAVRTYRGIHADLAFLSGNGLDAGFGLSTPSMIVAETDRTIAGCARELVVLADHTKLGTRTAVQTVPTERIAQLVTDAGSAAAQLEPIAARGVTLHIAATPVT